MFTSLLLTVLAVIPPAFSQNSASAEPSAIVHLGVRGTYEIDENQFDRVDARLAKENPGRPLISLYRDRDNKSFAAAPFELRELGFDLEARLARTTAPVGLVVVQATREDFAAFWTALDAQHPLVESLRGRLTSDARIVFTGAPALGDGEPETRARALLEGLGIPHGSFLAATTDVHVFRPKAQAWFKGAVFTLGAVSMGTAVAALSFVPREVSWVDVVTVGGGVSWIIADLGVKLWAETRRQSKLPVEERKPKLLTSVINLDAWMLGTGLSGSLAGFLYSGASLLNQSFALRAAAGITIAAATLIYQSHGHRVIALFKPKSLNRGVFFSAVDGDVVNIATDDARAFTCADVLAGAR